MLGSSVLGYRRRESLALLRILCNAQCKTIEGASTAVSGHRLCFCRCSDIVELENWSALLVFNHERK